MVTHNVYKFVLGDLCKMRYRSTISTRGINKRSANLDLLSHPIYIVNKKSFKNLNIHHERLHTDSN